MAGARLGLELIGPRQELFRLVDFLGRGAFGEVYRAVGTTSATVVAVKLLPIGELEDVDNRVALLNEAQLATRIVHPNVVQVLYVTRDSDIGPYIVMEYVPGGTLSKLLRSHQVSNSQLTFSNAREMMVDIVQGARAINQLLIHRDIKPDNILIDGQRMKISDFGISKVVDQRTRTHTFKGGQHIRYMAPEGWQQSPNTFKLDVYSVGLLFYEILTLRNPLLQFVKDANNWMDWRDAHLFRPCPDVRSIRTDASSALAQLLSRMVEKRPQERPDWDSILGILVSDEPQAEEKSAVGTAIAAAVEAAVTERKLDEQRKLKELELADRRRHEEQLYRYSCEQLCAKLDGLVDDFNRNYQFGSIEKDSYERDGRLFRLPNGRQLSCYFFDQRETTIRGYNRRWLYGD